MAKKGGKKNRGVKKPKGKNKPKVQVATDADLRYVPQHVENWLKGVQEAGQALMTLGRDAAYTVLALAQEKDHTELKEFGRKLAAIPPQVDTNLDALREQSVRDHLAKYRNEAPAPSDVTDYEIRGGAIALFDPKRIMENLVHHGRPRRDPTRLVSGALAWYGLPRAEPTKVRFVEDAPPEGQPTARLRVKIESGVLFVGPPEASDGPRLGAVRKNPFGTAIDEYAERSRFLKLKPGTYAVFAQMHDDALVAYLVKDRAPDDASVLDVDLQHAIPVFVDEDTTA